MKKLILIPLLVFSSLTKAQETKTLQLKDALLFALENKADAKKAKLKVENSTYQIAEVRSRALPQIAATGSLTYNPALQMTPIDASALNGPAGTTIMAAFGRKWNSGAGISLSQQLFDQSVFIGLKAAKSTKEFYQINEQLTEEQLIERVANAYYQVYVTRQNLNVLESNLQSTTKVKDIIQGLFDNGLAKKIDLDRISVNISNIQTQKQKLLNAVSLLENALKFYIGMPIQQNITIPQTEFEANPLALLTAPDTTTRTEYLLLKKNEQLLEYQKKSIVAAYYPTLSLSANFNYIGQGDEMPWFKNASQNVFWSNFASIGLNLRVPIFSGFGTQARVNQSENSLKSIKVDLEETKLGLDLAFENAKKQIENSLISITNQKENAKLAQQVLDNINNNYIQGLASLTDLLDAENANTQAKNNYTAAILDYKVAEIQLIKSKGELKSLLK
ncbi:MAG: outer membrane protein [Bacteroidota bacterium]|nr:outer membrane protein [Bacteroidota bacterium]